MNIEEITKGVYVYEPAKWMDEVKRMTAGKEEYAVKGVLFDMDGLILDTEVLYSRFWQEAANMLGYPMTRQQALSMRSLNREAGAAKLQSFFDKPVDYDAVRGKRIELMNAFIEKEGVSAKPGVEELLSYLREQGIKAAIATSSPMERAEKYLMQVGLENSFDEIISGYEVKKGKPEPDIYLCAAEKLGLKPWQCLALEDSPSGLLSANSAGCLPVMIPDQDEATEETEKLLFAKADRLDYVIDLLKWMKG